MDKMSWPWKKKSSDKQAADKADTSTTAYNSGSTQMNKGKQDNNSKNTKYVQISIESHAHLTGLEDQLKSCEARGRTLDDEVKDLNEKLFEAHSELTDKENLVKQHARVAEEAVSGWEKAEAEATTLKNHLESVTLLKLNAEDRASQLDGALKECMKQIRNLKEENDKKLNEVVLDKKKLYDEMKQELEGKLLNLNQQILRSAADNDALSRSLQERSNMLVKLGEEKSQADAEIEHLKSKIESCEKEVSSLKYELHIARKEVEIRTEEKSMSLRSAEVSNKQHVEGVKKIAKLEAECQRLRSLVRKKLPGPAALAQMKLEVESLGRDYGESRLRRSPRKPPISHMPQLPEFSQDNPQKYHRENELLIERLLAMDEEIRTLKEALSQCNGELHTSKSLCAELSSKLRNLEANVEQGSLVTSIAQVAVEGLSYQKATNPLRMASMIEDGIDDGVSCAGSVATVSMSELSYIREKNADSPHESRNSNHMDLMDDFLEMEKLAYESNGTHALVSYADVSGDAVNTVSELAKPEISPKVITNNQPRNDHDSESQLRVDPLTLVKIRSRIFMLLESISNEKNKVVDHVKRVMQDILDSLPCQSLNGVAELAHFSGSVGDLQTLGDEANITKGIYLSGDFFSGVGNVQTVNQELEIAISRIYDFVMMLGKEDKVVPGMSPDRDEADKNFTMLSAKYGDAINSKINLTDFVLDMSRMLHKARELHFNLPVFQNSEVETNSSYCIDKIVLPVNKAMMDSSKEGYPLNCCAHFSDSFSSDPDIPNSGNLAPTSESIATSWKCSLEELEQLKMENDHLAVDLARCMENFESVKSQLVETEQLLAEAKSQLASAQRSNSLAETQLKCMAESYKSLESQTKELQTEINLLRGKVETSDNELQEEKRSHQDALARCNDLQEQLQRIESHTVADNDKSSSQDELTTAAEKLAECQETIHLLSKQLKTLRPQTDSLSSPYNVRNHKGEVPIEEEQTATGLTLQDIDISDSEANNTFMRSPFRSKHRNNRPIMPGSSSSNWSTPTPEKQSRGFIKIFSSKGKNVNK